MSGLLSQPKPSSKTYGDLIRDIETGIIKVPKFQRDFVWSIEKTALLLDSILKGYPIGTFILWKTDQRMSDIKDIGEINLPDAPEGRQIEYVLDGQQRMTSLFAAYKGAKIKRESSKLTTDYRNIFVSVRPKPEDDTQLIYSDESADGRSDSSIDQLALCDVLSLTRTSGNDLKEDFGFSDSQLDLADKYRQIFTTYEFSTVTLVRNDIDSAIEVFTRINTGGSILTLFEIMVAKTYDEKQKFDLKEKWKEVDSALQKVSYGGLSPTIILTLLALMLSVSRECKRKTILSLEKDRFIEAWPSAVSALKSAIDYFRTTMNIPVSALLPYDIMLVPFAYWFFRMKHPPEGEAKVWMEELFWRSALSARYSSATESKMAADIRKVDGFIKGRRGRWNDLTNDYLFIDSAESVAALNFSTGNALCKAVLCILAYEEPKNFGDNGRVLLDNSFLKIASSKNYHHFFPKAYLRDCGIENANSIANITLIGADLNKRRINSRAPSEYIGEFQKMNKKMRKTLASHLISLDDMGVLEDDYDEFLVRRSEMIWEKLEIRLNGDG